MQASSEPRVPVVEWDGRAGLAALAGAGRFGVPDPSGFHASWRSVVVDGIELGEWATSAISGARPAVGEAAAVVVVLVVDGALRYWLQGGAVDGPGGSVHLVSGSDAVRFSMPGPTRLLSVTVPAAVLGPELRAATSGSIGAVPATRITAGLAALVEQVLDPTVGGAATAAARAVRALALAAIEDSVPDPAQRDLRAVILDHIERRIGDSDLGPQSIAAEFGVSVRWVHQIFNLDGDSVARHIRVRRLDVVAAQLRADRRFPRIGALAERTGFASRDQLTRAFKARFGVTIAEYAALADLGRAPEERSA